MTDWEILQSVYPEYARLMALRGWRRVSLVAPAFDGDSGMVLTEALFREQCGAVEAEVALRCEGGQLVQSARISRGSVGNRGYGGGTKGSAPRDAREAAGLASEYLGLARDLLH